MRKPSGGFIYLAAGILLGAVTGYAAVDRAGREPLAANSPWHSRTAALDGGYGLYVQDYFLMAGRLPLAPGQFAEAEAREDSDGNTLSASCRYEITSTGPLPAWWSLATMAGSTAPPSIQTAIDSVTVVRDADGAVKLVASATPQPGNWLKVEGGRRFTLLYAATTGGSRGGARAAPAFSIRQAGC